MKKFTIVCAIFILSGFVSTPIFAMQDVREKELRVTNGVTCEGCQRQFVKAEHRVEHIISVHYTCPWCSDLFYLNSGMWKKLSAFDLQQRVDHIKKCAEIKSTSLWQCKKCCALFHYAKKDHKCGVRNQVNLISNKTLDIEVILKADRENTCNICSKTFVHARACKNHIMREHATCPWCSSQFSEKGIPYKKLNLLDREVASAHLIECAQKNNESLFMCDTCFGVMLCSRTLHVGVTCRGVVYQAVQRVRDNNDAFEQDQLPLSIQEPSSAELLSLIQELASGIQGSSSSDQFSDQSGEEVLTSGVVVQDIGQEITNEKLKEQEHYFSPGQNSPVDFIFTNSHFQPDDQINIQKDDERCQAILQDLFYDNNDSF